MSVARAAAAGYACRFGMDVRRAAGRQAQKSAGVNSFAQIKKDLKPYMGQ